MVPNNDKNINAEMTVIQALNELGLSAALKAANINKRCGIEIKKVFMALFSLCFYGLSWNRFISSDRHADFAKDARYRFLKNEHFNWRTFIRCIALKCIELCNKANDKDKTKVLIFDDTPYARKGSEKTDMISRIYDHVSHTSYNGYLLLTCGWSDGNSFVPLDFAFTASKYLIQDNSDGIDKRTIGYKRRMEALTIKNDLVYEMVNRIHNLGVEFDYVLMDSWYSFPAAFDEIKTNSVDLIGMVKRSSKIAFIFNGKKISIPGLYKIAMKQKYRRSMADAAFTGILSTITVQTESGTRVRLVFAVNRNCPDKYVVISSSDTSLSADEIIEIYSRRWQTECFYKIAKG